jgi:hypothetical protein
MMSKVPVLAGVSGWALLAAFLVLGSTGCAPTAKPAAASSAAASRPSATANADPSVAPASSATPASLVAGATVRHELLAAFVAFRSNAANTPGFAPIAPSAVAGITPGTLHYAFDPASGTYWAVATFSATKSASRTSAYVGFQDGGSQAVFTRPSDGSWLVRSVGPCMTGLPVAVASAWGLTASPSPMCPSGAPAG